VSPVALLRRRLGATQQELARRAGTSQPTIAAYESGAKSPTLATLDRLAGAIGAQWHFVLTEPMTREDRRSLAYHNAIADRLEAGDHTLAARAKRNLTRQIELHPGARQLFDRWALWLALPADDLATQLRSPHRGAREMRHVSPFAGCLSASDRARILKMFRRDEMT
jgi:transcriptional regulator with XRE-family HTH domain